MGAATPSKQFKGILKHVGLSNDTDSPSVCGCVSKQAREPDALDLQSPSKRVMLSPTCDVLKYNLSAPPNACATSRARSHIQFIHDVPLEFAPPLPSKLISN